jgi:hypothetical protein
MSFADFMNFILAHGPEIISAIVGVLSGIIGICLLIPGDQPEKALQGIVDFLSKFSKKP